jgi:hypothetical protein
MNEDFASVRRQHVGQDFRAALLGLLQHHRTTADEGNGQGGKKWG